GGVTLHSTLRACGGCGRSFEPLDPKHFSYNSSVGWCGRCRGFGELFYLPDVDRGARADAIEESWYGWQEGEREVCPECMGMRLNPVARAVRLMGGGGVYGDEGVTMDTLAGWSVAEAADYFSGLRFRGLAEEVSRDILPEIRERLRFLGEVGLGYLQLGRGVPTLSGGEAQRIRLAAQLGSNLSGVLYVLDEPTIGLHARDNEQLLNALEMLRGRGNSLLVVEHDEATMRRADHVIDLGPGAGVEGGRVVAAGTLAQLKRNRDSLTGRCLSQARNYPARGERRAVGLDAGWLELSGAGRNNLRDVRLRLPLGRFSVVTGVSGSGKSTLLRECLLPVLTAALKGVRLKGEEGSGRGRLVSGGKELGAVYEVDQAPIGRTPRSVPATYVGFFDDIRSLYAQVPEARLRGYGAGRFSFNSAQGRCEGCEGAGEVKLEMNFLPPAFTRCEACGGRRFKPETLDVELGGRSIAEVLDMSVKEALDFFQAHPRIRRPLEVLEDTGLGYLKLGQPSPTLSGGEAQRVKLVAHLLSGIRDAGVRGGRRAMQPSFFLLEEPTIGLHMADVRLLVNVLQRLVDAGHTVVVIEHNLDLIAEADWVVDLGPEGGGGGGRIIAEGTPEQVAMVGDSHTGRFLKHLFEV
ncbi:MAG: excinuclease ABC subunit A, partial [Limisphaerales bacterium]